MDEAPETDGDVRAGTLSALRVQWAMATAEGYAGAFHADMLSAIEKLIGNVNPAVSARGPQAPVLRDVQSRPDAADLRHLQDLN